MNNSNDKKSEQLGMSHGTANHRLRKAIMFDMMVKLGVDNCFRCGLKIENVDVLSIEHKIPWLDSENPVELFYSLDNIAFSHLRCNSGDARKPTRGNKVPHGVRSRYTNHGCRCVDCTAAMNKMQNEYRRRKRNDL